MEIGNPVMSDRGLIGRVVGLTRGASRILLLTDVASRTPVLVDRTDARAILAGDSSSAPKLEYLRGQAPVKDGDRVLTSGDGGMFPRGLPVGTVVKGLDGVWRVQLDADETSIDFVRILLFRDFSALVDQKELSTLPLPPVGGLLVAPQRVTMAAPVKTPPPQAAAAPAPAATSPAAAAHPAVPAPPVAPAAKPVRRPTATPRRPVPYAALPANPPAPAAEGVQP